jgi:hypothetical protein
MLFCGRMKPIRPTVADGNAPGNERALAIGAPASGTARYGNVPACATAFVGDDVRVEFLATPGFGCPTSPFLRRQTLPPHHSRCPQVRTLLAPLKNTDRRFEENYGNNTFEQQ